MEEYGLPDGMMGFAALYPSYAGYAGWDKNFLKVIYLTLLRRQTFRCYGGVRFGGTLTINEAWDLSFDHIAIASGAGKPTIIKLKNNLIREIRKAWASDPGRTSTRQAANEVPNFQSLLQAWGGVTLLYRKGMRDAPAYRQDREEIEKVMEEGIAWAEGAEPREAIPDSYGHLRAVRFEKLAPENGRWVSAGEVVEVPLKSLFIAAGTLRR
jgi:NADPH-dependent glutamate synthase beta subunit-like oxidoreductase